MISVGPLDYGFGGGSGWGGGIDFSTDSQTSQATVTLGGGFGGYGHGLTNVTTSITPIAEIDMRPITPSPMDDGAYQSSSSNVWLLKFWVPLFWLIWTVALFKDDVFSVRIVGCIPFVLAFVFHMSLAVVRIRDGGVQYRRFLEWKSLPPTGVVSSGMVWLPFIGFLRLRKPQPPWGMLFSFWIPNRRGAPRYQAGLHHPVRPQDAAGTHDFPKPETDASPDNSAKAELLSALTAEDEDDQEPL
jgi:hypothetical protein